MEHRRRTNPPPTNADWHPAMCGLCAFLIMWAFAVSFWSGMPAAGAGVDGAAESEESPYPLAVQGPTPEPIVAPADDDIVATIGRGVDFLLEDQRPDGSWGSPEQTKGLNIYAPPPGAHDAFRTAVTALVVTSLVEALPSLPEEERAAVDEAIDRGEQQLVERLGYLRRATPDALYNVWGHAFGLESLICLHHRAQGDTERQARLHEAAETQVDFLRRFQFVNGGWSYYDFLAGSQTPSDSPMSFTTATVLIALHHAEQELGIEFPEKLSDKAIDSLHRQRKPDFSYAYGEYLRMRPMHPVNRPGGSLGRSQVCNLALRLYGDEAVTDEVMKTWLNRLFARNGWLSNGRKRPIPHEAHFAVAGYFYYYGHYYAARCIEQFPPDRQPYYQEHLARIILPLQEKDGSWWDFPFYNYHQQYGTAMAVSTLVRCRK